MTTERKWRTRKKLMRTFDRAVVRAEGFLVSRYGPDLAHQVMTDARCEYADIIPALPDLGGRQPFSLFITSTGWFLAFHRALTMHGRPMPEAGEFAYALTEQYVNSIPWVIAKLLGWAWFLWLFQLRVRYRARQSQRRRQQRGFVYEYVEGDGDRFDFGVDYHECAVWTFLKTRGAPELAPYVCALDQLYSEAFGWGLVRTTTLAEGGPRCDFRFKRGGETKIASTVLPLRQK